MTTRNNNANVVVGGNGTIFVSDTTATAPTDATSDLGAVAPHDAGAGDWVELGFISETGVTVTPGQTVVPIRAWQSFYPIRRIISERMLELDFVLREFNAESLPFAFGGGTLIETVGESFTFTPPAAQVLDFRSLCLDFQDGTKNFRLYVPNGQVTTLSSFTVSRTAPAELPVKFELNASGEVSPWTLFSDDTGLEGS